MSDARFVKLVSVTEVNNNKFYIMEWDGKSPTFNVEYGRVESTSQKTSYPLSKWDAKYREKIKKNYKDVTHTVAVKVETTKSPVKEAELGKIEERKVADFVAAMKRYTDGLVSKTYSVKAVDVTQEQVDNAQKILTNLLKIPKKDVTLINTELLNLYTEIPRYMGNVRDYLLPNIDLDKVLQQEQDNLDAMASQVSMLQPKKEDKKADSKKKKETKTILDVIGITMEEIKAPAELDYLIKQLGREKIQSVFRVDKPAENKVFEEWLSKQKNKQTRILIHGTKCTSVIPILEQGLKIRPTGNYQFSGKVYGDGNYFSEVCAKSLGYTGYDPDKVLLVYEVHTGNPFVYEGWYRGNSFSLCYDELQKRGFDSTHVNAGGGLLNSEIIAYKEQQCRIKYIIHLKR